MLDNHEVISPHEYFHYVGNTSESWKALEGQKVKHQAFGQGTVTEVKGDVVWIRFDERSENEGANIFLKKAFYIGMFTEIVVPDSLRERVIREKRRVEKEKASEVKRVEAPIKIEQRIEQPKAASVAAVLAIPINLYAQDAQAFAEKMWRQKDCSKVCFNFDQLNFAHPFGTLLILSELMDFLKHKRNAGVSFEGINLQKDVQGYLAHISFFRMLGLNIGNVPDQAKGSGTYMPITIIDLAELERETAGSGKALGEVIQNKSDKLAFIVTGKNELKTNRPVAYCFREVIRNVFEHASISKCTVAARKWERTGFIEIAIVDKGRGIKKSLEERHKFGNEIEYLQAALKPGVSRMDTSRETDDKWANSGFGLYVLSQLGLRTGEFLLCSGTTFIGAQGGKFYQGSFPFVGTAIQIKIQKPKGRNFEEFIKQIVAEGEVEASRESGKVRASQSTRVV